MKKFLALVGALVMVLVLVSCDSAPELTNVGTFEDFTLELGSAEITTSYDGRQALRVHAVYTNASEGPYYALSCFTVRAFQHDKELEDCSDINGDEAALIREVKNGDSLEVAYVFILEDESPVEVLIGEPTADQDTIGRANYLEPAGVPIPS